MKDIHPHNTFGRTGIHPPEMKLTAGSGIKDIPLPHHVEISLSQSLGRPAAPAVKPGDHVDRFDLIGEAQGPVSANVHTPISGTVKSVGTIATTDGHGAVGVIIEASDEDHAADLQNICDAAPRISETAIGNLSPEEIISTIRSAGIVGMGAPHSPQPPSSPPREAHAASSCSSTVRNVSHISPAMTLSCARCPTK